MGEPAVELKRVGFATDGRELIRDVSLEAGHGEVVAVVGPNGAGKSTLVSIVAGLLQASNGSVALLGDDPSGLSGLELARTRTVLFGNAPAALPFTVRQVVAAGRFPHRRDPDNTADRDAGAIESAMVRADIAHLSGRRYSTLSSGERMRVTIARMLAQDCPIVLADEPTTSLDVAHHEAVMQLMRELADEGRSVLVVVHDLNAAAAYAHRTVLMHRGRIVGAGPAATVFDARLLSDVYDHPLVVVDHPMRDCPLVLSAEPRHEGRPFQSG